MLHCPNFLGLKFMKYRIVVLKENKKMVYVMIKNLKLHSKWPRHPLKTNLHIMITWVVALMSLQINDMYIF